MKDLFEAILMLKNADEAKRFFTDLCTPKELEALKERWKVCQLLNAGTLSYREISEKTGSSTTTVTRVARFLNDEPYGGYKSLLKRINQKTEGKNV
ncbi:MAG: trp operon repressor [Holosporales bacterium]|jgi:TrpR-related protein YerC/YecD|nr:trp operon repressor [Holosporales bacterium]